MKKCHTCDKQLQEETDFSHNWWHYLPSGNLVHFCDRTCWYVYVKEIDQ